MFLVYKLPNQNKNIDNYPSTSTQYSFPNHKNDLYINQLKLYSPISKIDVTKNNGIPTLSNGNTKPNYKVYLEPIAFSNLCYIFNLIFI